MRQAIDFYKLDIDTVHQLNRFERNRLIKARKDWLKAQRQNDKQITGTYCKKLYYITHKELFKRAMLKYKQTHKK